MKQQQLAVLPTVHNKEQWATSPFSLTAATADHIASECSGSCLAWIGWNTNYMAEWSPLQIGLTLLFEFKYEFIIGWGKLTKLFSRLSCWGDSLSGEMEIHGLEEYFDHKDEGKEFFCLIAKSSQKTDCFIVGGGTITKNQLGEGFFSVAVHWVKTIWAKGGKVSP